MTEVGAAGHCPHPGTPRGVSRVSPNGLGGPGDGRRLPEISEARLPTRKTPLIAIMPMCSESCLGRNATFTSPYSFSSMWHSAPPPRSHIRRSSALPDGRDHIVEFSMAMVRRGKIGVRPDSAISFAPTSESVYSQSPTSISPRGRIGHQCRFAPGADLKRCRKLAARPSLLCVRPLDVDCAGET
jgi:hypothetical protein